MRLLWLSVMILAGGCQAMLKRAESKWPTGTPTRSANDNVSAQTTSHLETIKLTSSSKPDATSGSAFGKSAHDDAESAYAITTEADQTDESGWRPTSAESAHQTPEDSPPHTASHPGTLESSRLPRVKITAFAQSLAAAQPSEPSSHASDSRATTDVLSLSLDQAIQWSLQNNPDLIIQRASEPVQHAAYHTAETYPFNPQFSTRVMPYAREADGNAAETDQEYSVLQTLELAHQQRYREAEALADWNRVRHETAQTELLAVAETERLFFQALYQRAVRDLTRQVATLDEQVVNVVQRQFDAGQVNQADVVLARLETQAARQEADLADTAYKTAISDMCRHLNLPDARSVMIRGQIIDWKWLPVDKNEVSVLVSDRPEVSAARFRVEAARTRVDLAAAQRMPNLGIGPVYARDEAATSFWGLQAQINLPIVNTGTPLVRQREAELWQQQTQLEQLRIKTQLDAQAAIQRYERARRLVEQSRNRAQQTGPDVLRLVQDQFEAGQISLLRVLAAQRSLIQTRRAELDLLNELAQAAAQVIRATGIPVRSLLTSQTDAETP